MPSAGHLVGRCEEKDAEKGEVEILEAEKLSLKKQLNRLVSERARAEREDKAAVVQRAFDEIALVTERQQESVRPELRWGLVFIRSILVCVLRHDYRNHLRSLLLGWWLQSNRAVLSQLGDALENSQRNTSALLQRRASDSGSDDFQRKTATLLAARRMALTGVFGLVALHLNMELVRTSFRFWSTVISTCKVSKLLDMLAEAKEKAEAAFQARARAEALASSRRFAMWPLC